mmetsp:Transcript_35641/g.70245  ORF Transcript_35641/g.70245 Transcript_35641/m.70245 type:complete len:160 (-) Transcript_35641:333-812(-)
MMAAGVKHLASALNAEAVPDVRVLILKKNEVTYVSQWSEQRDYVPLSALLSTSALGELEKLNMSDNKLFDEEIGTGGAVAQVSLAVFLSQAAFQNCVGLIWGGSSHICPLRSWHCLLLHWGCRGRRLFTSSSSQRGNLTSPQRALLPLHGHTAWDTCLS